MRLFLRRPACWRERHAPQLRASLLRASLLWASLLRASLLRAALLRVSLLWASLLRAALLRASLLRAALLRVSLLCASLLATSCVAPPLALGQAPADPVILELSSRVERFLRDVGESPGIRKPFETLLQASLLAAPEKIDPLLAATDRMRSQYGAFVAAEQIGARRVGQDLVLLTYIYKLEKFPVLWRFAYYRPRETAPWTLVSLRFDGKLLELTQDPP